MQLMKKLITVTPDQNSPRVYNFVYENGVHMGIAYPEVDGYYVFQDKGNGGYGAEELLYAIADELRLLNRGWDTQCGRDPQIGGTPDYQPPATMGELRKSSELIKELLLADHSVAEGTRKMEGLTTRNLYPWMRPVWHVMMTLLKTTRGEVHEPR